MCGRFSLGASAATLTAQFDLFEAPAWIPRYNIAPTQEVLVVVQDPTSPSRQARYCSARCRLVAWARRTAVKR
jgi:putative SOS response-associated peptidase YedK